MDDTSQILIFLTSTAFTTLSIFIVSSFKFQNFTKKLKPLTLNTLCIFAAGLSVLLLWLLTHNESTLTKFGTSAIALSLSNSVFFTAAKIIICGGIINKKLSYLSIRLNPVMGPGISILRWLWRSLLTTFVDTKHEKAMLDYTKMMFDGIKQIALVVTIAFGLTLIQQPMIDIKIPCSGQALINWVYALFTSVLLSSAFVWMLYSFHAGPFLKFLHRLIMIVFGLISLAFLDYLVISDYAKLPFDVTSIQKPEECTGPTG